MVELWNESDTGLVLAAAYRKGDTLASPLLEGLNIPLEAIFALKPGRKPLFPAM